MEMAVADVVYQITAICACCIPKKEECPDTFSSIQAYYEKIT